MGNMERKNSRFGRTKFPPDFPQLVGASTRRIIGIVEDLPPRVGPWVPPPLPYVFDGVLTRLHEGIIIGVTKERAWCGQETWNNEYVAFTNKKGTFRRNRPRSLLVRFTFRKAATLGMMVSWSTPDRASTGWATYN